MSSDEPITTEQEAPSRESILVEVGNTLKSARDRKNLSIDSIASDLKLRKVYLQALEDGDWSSIPGEVYALGFLRQYAHYLQLDLDERIKQLKSGNYQLTKPLTFPDPPIAPKRSWMIAAALLFIILFIGFNIWAPDPAPLPSDLMQESAETLQHADTKPLTQAKLSDNNKTNSLTTTKTVTDKTAGQTEPSQKPTMYHYTLTAVNGDVWLQLHDSSEPPTLIREVLLKQGEHMDISHPTPLRLTSGNPLALKIDLNQKNIVQVNQLGEKGKVLRDYLLQ